MADDFSTPNKICIRNNYNKKIIKYLKEKCGYNIIYFGLPSPEAKDVECWLEYISYVIAFQCRDYKQISTPDLPTDEVNKLIARLNEWEAALKIEGYDVYDGFMEEVIFNGQDNSSSGSVPFTFENSVTLFNLDFCNKITSPQEYIDSDGNVVKKHKFELIDEILEFQNNVSEENQGFVLFLTINAGYKGAQLSSYREANHQELSKYDKCSKSEQKRFILKHFVESVLYDKFQGKNFIPYFLPTVQYNGISDIEMMQFAIICIKPREIKKNAGVFTLYQTKQEVLNYYPIIPNCEEDSFTCHEPILDHMSNSMIDFMTKFCNSSTHSNYWKL